MKLVAKLLTILSTSLAMSMVVISIGASLAVAEEAPNTNVDKAIGLITTPTPNSAIESVPSVGSEGIPIYPFISWGLTILTIILGVWVLINIILAAFTYLGSSGDTASHQKVRTQITNSLIGLMLIVLAYTITAILSTILFGSPDFFFNPVIRRIY